MSRDQPAAGGPGPRTSCFIGLNSMHARYQTAPRDMRFLLPPDQHPLPRPTTLPKRGAALRARQGGAETLLTFYGEPGDCGAAGQPARGTRDGRWPLWVYRATIGRVSDDAAIPEPPIRMAPERVEHRQDRRAGSGAGGVRRHADMGPRAFFQRAGSADETGQITGVLEPADVGGDAAPAAALPVPVVGVAARAGGAIGFLVGGAGMDDGEVAEEANLHVVRADVLHP